MNKANPFIYEIYIFFILFFIGIIFYDSAILLNLNYLSITILLISIIPFYLIGIRYKNVNSDFISFKVQILFYLLLHIYVFCMSVSNEYYLNENMMNGDAEQLHYPMVEMLSKEGGILNYLANVDNFLTITGKITHVFYYFTWSIWTFFFESTFRSFMFMSFIVNMFIVLICSLFAKRIVFKITNNIALSNFSFFLISFSPFILAWSFMPMKEPLLILLILIVFKSLIDGNLKLLIFATILIFFERIYFLYFIGIIFILSNQINIVIKLAFIFLFSFLFFLIIPLDQILAAQSWITEYNTNRIEDGSSNLSSGTLQSIIRLFFSPNPMSIFNEYGIMRNYYYMLHFLTTPFMLIMLFKIARINLKFTLFLCFFYIINFALFPEASRQKITILIPFIAIFYPISLISNKLNIKEIWKI